MSTTYQIVVHHAAEGGYWAEVPALPGCVSQGETREELQANIQEAIAGYLEVMKEDGRHPDPVDILEVAM